MSDRVLVELSEDVTSVDADGDEVTLWAAGQQVWLDKRSADSFVKNRGAKLVEAEEPAPEPEPVARKVDPKKVDAPAGDV
jgi:hypothetical protein